MTEAVEVSVDDLRNYRDNDPNFRKTLNHHGHQMNVLDEYGKAFIAYVETLPHTAKVADLGVAFGFSSKALLNTGTNVYVNDLSDEHLKAFYDTLNDEEKERCVLVPGNVLDIQIPAASLHGILALRWFHFLTGDQVRLVLSKFYSWLLPGSKVVITASSPYGKRSALSEHSIEEYEQKKQRGDLWPGFRERSAAREVDPMQQKRPHMDFDTDVLERELKLAGFEVEKVGYIQRDFYPDAVKDQAGRDHTGCIAIKPNKSLHRSVQ